LNLPGTISNNVAGCFSDAAGFPLISLVVLAALPVLLGALLILSNSKFRFISFLSFLLQDDKA
jgi:hypothetical protein